MAHKIQKTRANDTMTSNSMITATYSMELTVSFARSTGFQKDEYVFSGRSPTYLTVLLF